MSRAGLGKSCETVEQQADEPVPIVSFMSGAERCRMGREGGKLRRERDQWRKKRGVIIIRKVYVSQNSIFKKKENENKQTKRKHRDVEGCTVCEFWPMQSYDHHNNQDREPVHHPSPPPNFLMYLCSQTLPLLPVTGNKWSVVFPHSFIFSRIFHKWNTCT